MNDFDDTTFARFARRFARIEQLVPDPATREFTSARHPKRGGVVMLRSAVLLGATLLLGVALAFFAIGSRPTPTVTLPPATLTPTAMATVPPDSADASTVLATYLGALEAGDCDLADQLIGSYASRSWNDALCRARTVVTASRIVDEPLFTRPNRVLIGALLAMTGTSPELGPPGEAKFTFELEQQAGGAWRVVEWHPGLPVPPSWWPAPAST